MGKRAYRRKRQGDWIERWTGVMIGVYLLFMGFQGYGNISPTKTATFYALMVPLVGIGAYCLIRELRTGKGGRLSGAQIAALVFLGCTLLSAAFSPYGSKAWYSEKAHEAALTVCCYVLLFLIVSRWGAAKEGHFRVLFWALVLFCLLCAVEAAGINPLGLYPSGLNYYDGDVKYHGLYAGTLGNVDLVSAFLALVIPMLLLHTRGQKAKQAWPCWALAAVCTAVLLWIKVLCGIVGLAMGGAVCALVLCPDRMRKWLLLIFLGLGLAVLALLYLVDLPLKFLHELHEILHGRVQDSFGTGRFYIWRQMLERVPDRLFFGVGPDAARFSGLSPFVRHDELGNIVYGTDGRPITAAITDAHCYPLHILYCQGLPALLSWLTAVGLVLRRWYRNRGDQATALLGAGLVCFLCAMLFCFSSVIIMPFFWLTMGLLEARSRQIESASGCSRSQDR